MVSFPGISTRIQRGFSRVVDSTSFFLEKEVLFSTKSSSSFAAGVSLISVTSLPSDLSGVVSGDKFGSIYTISGAVTASGGSISSIPFSPSLAASLSSGSIVQIKRTTRYSFSGWSEIIPETDSISSNRTKQKYEMVYISKDTISVEVLEGDIVITPNGRKSIVEISLDAIAAFISVKAVG